MEKIKQLTVFYDHRKVGRLAIYKKYLTAFEYDREWLENGFSISPFSLPLQKGVFVSKADPFEGLFGIFADSLPDGFGRLLVDRLLLSYHLDPMRVGSLNRLAIVGESGMGALTYKPDIHFESPRQDLDLDEISKRCREILETSSCENLDHLFHLGGSSGGARPKILTKVDGEDWIIKFPSSGDRENIGRQEYDYSLCAKKCGIQMSETRLFPSAVCQGYFGTKRFDRFKDAGKNEKRIHMISVSALLETSHRIPNLDYNILMRLTLEITKNFTQVEQLYRLMCFNVFAHNRDDHSKNFTYLYDAQAEKWVLSPAYDLTYSYSLNGEHATTVNGEGQNPGLKDLIAVAKNIGISEATARSVAFDVHDSVKEYLSEYFF